MATRRPRRNGRGTRRSATERRARHKRLYGGSPPKKRKYKNRK